MKSATKAVKDKEIGSMFNQLLGTGDLNMNISYPRFLELRDFIGKYLTMIEKITTSAIFEDKLAPEHHKAEIERFVKHNRELLDTTYSYVDLHAMGGEGGRPVLTLEEVTDEHKKEFAEVHKKFKDSETVGVIAVICKNLMVYKKYLEVREKLDHRFLLQSSLFEFCPLPFTRLNFKKVILTANGNKDIADYVTLYLHKLLTKAVEFNKLLQTPEIDVNDFVDYIMQNIDKIKEHIPRCDKAFSKIENSVDLLKDNFSNYYKDFVTSGSPTAIMENFVTDVAKNTNADAETTRQFARIVTFYQKVAKQNNIKDPRINAVFDKLRDSFTALDVNIEEVDDSDLAENAAKMTLQMATTNKKKIADDAEKKIKKVILAQETAEKKAWVELEDKIKELEDDEKIAAAKTAVAETLKAESERADEAIRAIREETETKIKIIDDALVANGGGYVAPKPGTAAREAAEARRKEKEENTPKDDRDIDELCAMINGRGGAKKKPAGKKGGKSGKKK